MQWLIDFFKSLFGGGSSSSSIKWEKRIEAPMLFFSAPNYFWVDVDKGDVGKILDTMLKAGCAGPSVEMSGSDTANEYAGHPDNENLAVRYHRHIKLWEERWIPEIRKRNLVAHIAFLNTNSKKNNSVSDTEWKNLFNEFFDKCGTDNMIILAASETDGRTRASTRAVLNGVLNAHMPPDQRVVHGSPGEGFQEYHSQSGKDVPHAKYGHRSLVVSDSGPAIAYMYGGDWKNGGTPNIPNIIAYTDRIQASDGSGAIYSFSKKFDEKGCKEAGKAWKS